MITLAWPLLCRVPASTAAYTQHLQLNAHVVQHHFEGEETDFDECFIFPERKAEQKVEQKAESLHGRADSRFSLRFELTAQRSAIHDATSGLVSNVAGLFSLIAQVFH